MTMPMQDTYLCEGCFHPVIGKDAHLRSVLLTYTIAWCQDCWAERLAAKAPKHLAGPPPVVGMTPPKRGLLARLLGVS